jgi:hypothetical protein
MIQPFLLYLIIFLAQFTLTAEDIIIDYQI